MTDPSAAPASFHKLTPMIERTFVELIRETEAVWSWCHQLYTDGVPWEMRRIPKKKGFRTIHAPKDPLMAISRGILHHVLRRLPVHRSVHGSEPRSSVITNARVHAGFAKSVYNLDLENAFPSTNRKRLVANLSPKMLALLLDSTDLSEEEASVLVELLIDLMLVDDILPQGFPTSPAVLNIVLLPVDREISRYLRQVGEELGCELRYTRYVDDITISSDGDRIPKPVRNQIRKIIRHNGWKINQTKLMYHGDAEPGDDERSTKMPMVTGLVIHDDGRLTVPRWKLRKWRALMHELLQAEDVSQDQRDTLVGVVSFLTMVYDGDLPSAVRQPYLDCKARFGIRDADERRGRFPERGKDSGT